MVRWHTSGRAAGNGGVEPGGGWGEMVGWKTLDRAAVRYSAHLGGKREEWWGGRWKRWRGGGWDGGWEDRHAAGVAGRWLHCCGAPDGRPQEVASLSGG